MCVHFQMKSAKAVTRGTFAYNCPASPSLPVDGIAIFGSNTTLRVANPKQISFIVAGTIL